MNIQRLSLSFLALLVLSMLSACQKDQSLTSITQQIPVHTQQLLVVLSDDEQATTGYLHRYYKHDDQWLSVGSAIPIQLGRSGLAWGSGLHQNPPKEYQKREGDGKAPAGIFELGTAFGYHTKPSDVQLPYRVAGQYDYYVDDVNADDYNQWVALDSSISPEQRWQSFERMRRDDHRYELGLEVEHNKSPVIAGNGSAIFLHVWKDPQTPTAGCTAMSKDNMLTVLQWLDPQANPLLVQVAKTQIDQLQFAK